MIFNEKDVERFWEKVDIGLDHECWYWIGGIAWSNSVEVRYRYGRFCANGKTYKAHRVSYTITKRKIPNNHVVRHDCDNPLCCNPKHLISGTQKQNDMDRMKRGRTRNQHLGRITSL